MQLEGRNNEENADSVVYFSIIIVVYFSITIYTYDLIFEDEGTFIEDSKVTRNYRHFYDLLTKAPQQISFDELLDAIERLQII